MVIDLAAERGVVVHGDNAEALPRLPSESFQLIYIDPPFNTGIIQQRRTLRKTSSGPEPRAGFRGSSYTAEETRRVGYLDAYDDYLAFIAPKLEQAHRLLKSSGTLYFHIDYREAHYCKVLLDDIFGRDNFLNEVIWAYDYGGRAKDRWPAKHDTILVYVKDPKKYHFDSAEVDREPYMAPGLVTPEKRALGKLPTDVWWHTIVSPTGKEKTGYPTQKPEGVLRRIVAASSRPGDWVLDFFAGSGTTGAVAAKMGRQYVLIDQNVEAIEVMKARLPEGTTYIEV